MKNITKSYPFAKKNISKIIFVSGNTRSGKVLVLKIIASLKGIEKVNVNFLMEQANFLTHTNDISKKAAVYFLRRSFSILDYNLKIGREINFRKKDYTSIYNYRKPERYKNNLKINEGDNVIQILKKEKNIIPLMVHNGLLNTNLFDAFDNLIFFEMIRNPISTIFSWLNKGYDDKFYNSYRASCLTLKYKNKIIPYYAYGWESKYLKSNKYERIIEMLLILEKQKEKTLKKLSKTQRNKIFYIKLEKLHTDPNIVLNKIEKILKKKKTVYTNKIFKNERLPREGDLYDIEIKKKIIKKKISISYYKKLLFLEKKYLKNYNYIK